MSFGAKLKNLREAKGMPRAAIDEVFSLMRGTCSNWENGYISDAEIAAKLPKGTETVFVRVDQNKLWWIKGEETGSVDIW